jgi:hypothetical protein
LYADDNSNDVFMKQEDKGITLWRFFPETRSLFPMTGQQIGSHPVRHLH